MIVSSFQKLGGLKLWLLLVKIRLYLTRFPNIQDSNACLPAEISESIPKAIIELLEAHDKSEIVSKLKACIEETNSKISPLQKELKSKGKQTKKKEPKKVNQKKAASKAKESPASVNPSEEKSTEVRFREIIKEVR